MTTTFENAKLGDRVYTFLGGKPDQDGHNATIADIRHQDVTSPLRVVMDALSDRQFSYLFDGRYFRDFREQCLFWRKPDFVVPEQPKRKVKKTLTGWLDVYPHHAEGLYQTRDAAESFALPGRIACVHISQGYEVEE